MMHRGAHVETLAVSGRFDLERIEPGTVDRDTGVEAVRSIDRLAPGVPHPVVEAGQKDAGFFVRAELLQRAAISHEAIPQQEQIPVVRDAFCGPAFRRDRPLFP